MVDYDRLRAAFATACCDLHAESEPAGHWIGRPSSSALSTATAVSALALVQRHSPVQADGQLADEALNASFCDLIIKSLRWLVKTQNADGGWGDTSESGSNLSTTMLVRAAFQLTCVPAGKTDTLTRAEQYIEAAGGVSGLRRQHGANSPLVAATLANYAMAELISWRETPAPAFEQLVAVDAAPNTRRTPAADAVTLGIGQARYFHRKPRNPLQRMARGKAIDRGLALLAKLQSAQGVSGSPAATSFVVMSLATTERAAHPIARRGIDFLLASARPDGSWPLGAETAVANTALAITALAAAGDESREPECFDYILQSQRSATDPLDVDTAAAVLLALATRIATEPTNERICAVAADALRSIIQAQHALGGWSDAGSNWAAIAAVQESVEATAHALRALQAWRKLLATPGVARDFILSCPGNLSAERLADVIDRGVRWLLKQQQADGSWNSAPTDGSLSASEGNSVVATARVLLAMRDLERLDTTAARRALDWLSAAKQSPSVVEMALAAEALISAGRAAAHQTAAQQRLKWLVDAVEANRHAICSPIRPRFAKLWHQDQLTPLLFTVAALGQAVRRSVTHAPTASPPATVQLGKP